ncbi:MAG: phosphatidate cytidylyltransferase [Bradymonadaceae bacterium]
MAKKKSDLLPRVITAVVAIPLLLGLIFYAPHWAFFALVAAAAAVSIWEYSSITHDHKAGKIFTVAVGLGLINALYFAPEYFLDAVAASIVAIFLFFLFFFKDQGKVTQQIGSSITAIFYGGVLLTLVALLGRDAGDAGPMWILLLLAVVWGSDTGAYFAGVTLGKHKLYPAVSPNKSVEGSIGGVLSSIGFAFLLNALFSTYSDAWTTLTVVQVLILAIPANLLGQTGDLAESLVKRAHEVKDSGTIIYGHGGILDRIDALFFAAPWFYFYFARLAG